MGLDVYTGTLTRYYSGDWETFWQQAARKAGMESVRVEVGGGGVYEIGKDGPQEVYRAVLSWRETLQAAVSDAPEPLRFDWDESSERPYFTYKPGWEGHAALMLHAAYAMRPDMERPDEVPDDWENDPAYRATMEGNPQNNHCGFIMLPELWLPGRFMFFFRHRDLRGQEVVIGATEALLANLHGLNEHSFRADPETAARWLGRDVREAENHFEANARYGFAIYLYLAEQAVANVLPMKLDY